MDVYPVVDCKQIKTQYGSTLNHYAVLEWHFITEVSNKKDLTSSTGALECFCADLGILEAFNSVYTTAESHSGMVIQGKICYDWEMGVML